MPRKKKGKGRHKPSPKSKEPSKAHFMIDYMSEEGCAWSYTVTRDFECKVLRIQRRARVSFCEDKQFVVALPAVVTAEALTNAAIEGIIKNYFEVRGKPLLKNATFSLVRREMKDPPPPEVFPHIVEERKAKRLAEGPQLPYYANLFGMTGMEMAF